MRAGVRAALLRFARAVSAAPLRGAGERPVGCARAATGTPYDVRATAAALQRLRAAGVHTASASASDAAARVSTESEASVTYRDELRVEARESEELELNHDDEAGFVPGSVRRAAFQLEAPLGSLRTVRIRLRDVPLPPDAPPDGWFLEEVRVLRPSTGHTYRFPCRRWLGAAYACGSSFPRELEVDVVPGGGPSEPPPPPPPLLPLSRPLTLRTGAAAVPHPDKMRAGARGMTLSEGGHAGEDAYFVTSSPHGAVALGVSDGVYMWKEKGIDAGLFSRALCVASAAAAARGVASPLRLLQAAYGAVMAAGVQGSATCCVAVVDARDGLLRSANVGDSGYLLMTPKRGAVAGRPGGAAQQRTPQGWGEAVWQPGGVTYRSPQQEHEFGRPYQLGHHRASDRPEDAMLHSARLCGGDVVVMGSDGLWDNLHDSEVAQTVQQGVDARLSPAAIARAVAAEAYERSSQKRGSTPYSLAATDAHELVFCGGKRDDICVLVLLAEA